MTTFVLVAGAWHGGWCWQRVAQALRQQGHDVYTPSLTGVADRAHLIGPDVTLSTHINDICGIIESYDLTEVVLCGHSYAGLIITGVADRHPDRLRALVYLDALVPEDGQSMFDTIPDEIAQGFIDQAAAGDGFSVPPMTAEQFNVNAADAAWMEAKCTDHPLHSFDEPIALTGAYEQVTNCSYVLADGFDHPGTKAAYAMVKDRPNWTASIMEGGHDLMIDNPDAVVALLLAQA